MSKRKVQTHKRKLYGYECVCSRRAPDYEQEYLVVWKLDGVTAYRKFEPLWTHHRVKRGSAPVKHLRSARRGRTSFYVQDNRKPFPGARTTLNDMRERQRQGNLYWPFEDVKLGSLTLLESNPATALGHE
jgi:hypothetical protein